MTRAVGTALPPPLWERLRGTDLAERLGMAILIATPDEAGWPHPAMLSYGEAVAVDPHRIRLAIHPASRTAANLRRSGKLTLCFVEAGLVYYVKAAARVEEDPMVGMLHLARFEAVVQMVLADEARTDTEAGAIVTDGIRFAVSRPVEAVLRDWESVVERLRGDACG
jgi:hypothetical protein